MTLCSAEVSASPAGVGKGAAASRPAAAFAVMAAAFLVIAVMHAVFAGAPSRLEGLDTDDYMRLQEVRDFLGGQAWADVSQHRLDTPEGGSMHFSRLPDAPMAAIVAAARPFLGDEGAETLLLVLWPAGMLVLYLFGCAAAAGAVDCKSRILSVIFAAVSLPTLAQFRPGRIDHHALQIVLVCFALYFVLRSFDKPKAGLWAGLLIVLMLSVGMETAPYAAALAAAAALPWLSGGDERGLGAFGAGLLTAAPATLIVSRFGGDLGAVQCDAYSAPQLAAAMLTGGGAMLLARAGGGIKSARGRLAAALGLGAVAAAFLAALFPGCMTGPYARLDPMVADLWLNTVGEARGLSGVLATAPNVASLAYLFPAAGVVLAAINVVQTRGAARSKHAAIFLLLLTALAVSAWQLRGASFANAFAVLPAALFLARMDARTGDGPRRVRPLAVLAPAALSPLPAILLSIFIAAAGGGDKENAAAGACRGPRAAFAPLNAAPAGLVMTPIDLGPPVIALTHHSATSAPYHRNVGGMKRSLAFFTAGKEEARALLEDDPSDYVIVCPHASDLKTLAARYPHSVAAMFAEGRAPVWLEEIPMRGAQFRFYRVAFNGRAR
ncbi:MAG: hypothetical protein VX640_07310 [Pseudomonadota bacterium]|nr:hypothetical protein [Pseudomonadota bacterium]